MSKLVLVTGATGYIGAHTVKRLRDLGHTVHGLDYNLNQNDIDAYVEELFEQDITEPFVLGYDYDAVIHLAAQTKVSPSVANPAPYYATNVMGTLNVINATAHSNPHFVYCSTGTAFQPEASPYGMSKRAGEDMLAYTEGYTVCRFYNVVGNAGFHKYDSGYYHLMRKCAAVINGLADTLEIYGTEYDTFDGTAVRNYTHVSDIVDALVRILDHGATNQIECLGSTQGYSVREVVKAMQLVSSKSFPVVEKPARAGDVAVSLLPKQSRYFTEKYTLHEKCRSTLENEK